MARGRLVGQPAYAPVYAIDPNRAVSQYLREGWGAEKGFPGGPVYAIAQTPDGYLWMGTEKGLVRFDGWSFQLFQPASPPALPDGPVRGLLVDAEGNLWITLRNPSLVRYRAGTFENALTTLAQPEHGITAMTRDGNGAALFSTLGNGTLKYQDGKFVTLAPRSELPNFLVIALAETPDGGIWLGTRDAGLFRLTGGQISAIVQKLPDRKINCLLPDGQQGLWVGTDNGVVRWNGTAFSAAGVPPALARTQALTMLRDRDGNVWIGTAAQGLLRLNANGIAALASNRPVTALFEDREGNLWVGSAEGLERVRDSAFVSYEVEKSGALYVDEESRAWFAPATGGLRWLDGAGRTQRIAAFDNDVVYSIAGGDGELWLGRQRGGLTRLRNQGEAISYTQAEGLAQNSVYAVYRTRDGSVWAGTLSGGVSRFSNGKFTTYTSADGLASNAVTALLESADGTIWFGTPNGLSALSQGRWQTYRVADGLPADAVNCLWEDAAGVLWIGTAEGLAYLKDGRIHRITDAPAYLREPLFGLAGDRHGALWLAMASQVLRVSRDKLLNGALNETDVRAFGRADGLLSVEGVKRHRSVVTDARGRVWFALQHGLSVVDPARLTSASAPALAHIESLTADGQSLERNTRIQISSARQRLTFSFTGLSLAQPQQVRVRYKLDGFDADWSAPQAAREAAYTNLNPGAYRFRVIASNADGLWNGAEATLAFQIEPQFWQRWWFRLLPLLAGALLMLALYRWRLRQITRQMNLRVEERLAERTRIAQELHDTLLQGFLSASMQLHVAAEQVPEDAPAKPRLNRVLQLMSQVIEEGRNAIRGLRAADGDLLEQAFARLPQELALREPIRFRVVVAGQPRSLPPLLRDEAFRIGREALVNAFRHAQAQSIEVELEYAAQHLRILVRDDGCGIDPLVLRSGRAEHWGLAGMRERAERIGARLTVRSREATGTEVELSIPSRIAFESEAVKPSRRWFARMKKGKAA